MADIWPDSTGFGESEERDMHHGWVATKTTTATTSTTAASTKTTSTKEFQENVVKNCQCGVEKKHNQRWV